MTWLFHLVFGSVLVALSPGAALALVDSLSFMIHAGLGGAAALGAAGGLVAARVVRRRFPLFCTFEHELAHLLVALLFLCRPRGFVVNRYGGLVRHDECPLSLLQPLARDVVSLAPYVLPTWAIGMVLSRPWSYDSGPTDYTVLLAAAIGYHLVRAYEETRHNWRGGVFPNADNGLPARSDIARTGWIFSAIAITGLSLNIYGALLTVGPGGATGLIGWRDRVWHHNLGIKAAAGREWSRIAHRPEPIQQRLIPRLSHGRRTGEKSRSHSRTHLRQY